jgi:hypothetical protein
MIFGIDEDGVVGAGGHAGFAANADRLVKIHDAVGALEHCRRGTRSDTRRMGTLITAGHLVRAPRLRKLANINVLYVGARHRQRYFVFRFTGGRAGVTANTARVVNDLGPLDVGGLVDHRIFARSKPRAFSFSMLSLF